ncbi:MAG: nucleotide exchange factor GrpE [Burkholderiales bacterium]|nr:nucleotide exchange factor GrpE [Sulfuricellaceae bacterium]
MQAEQPSNEPQEVQDAATDSSQPSDAAAELSTEELLAQAQQTAEEHRNSWLRALADADNIRKRAQLDVSNAHKYALENFSKELLSVKDSLEAALAVETATLDSIKDGVDLTLKQLNSVLGKFKITEINPVGEKFDPHRHQAMTMIESDAAPNTVVNVLQKGYLLDDRVIRPALVVIAKP